MHAARHNNVREHQVKLAILRLQGFQGGEAILRLDHVVAHVFQHGDGDIANGVIVFDDENTMGLDSFGQGFRQFPFLLQTDRSSDCKRGRYMAIDVP